MFKKTFFTKYGFAVLSGVLTTVSLPGVGLFPFAFFALTLLLWAIWDASFRMVLLLSFVSGFTSGILFYYWSVQSAIRYSGTVTVEQFFVYALLCVYQAVWVVLFGVSYFLLKRKIDNRIFLLLSVSSIFVCVEWLHNAAGEIFPWNLLLPYSQWNNILLLQFAPLGGIWLIAFFLAAVNMLLLFAILERNKENWIAAGIFIVAIHLAGAVLLFSEKYSQEKKISVAILQENIRAEKRWEKLYADTLAAVFLTLNKQSVQYAPQLIVWSETALSWTFSENDDLLDEALRITYSSGASHLAGMLTPIPHTNDVYNSLYYIERDGKISSRYDKKHLLAFLEQPLFNYSLPFAHQQYSAIRTGERRAIIPTAMGVLGVLICNESLSPYPASSAVQEGAQALIVASNDAWFENTVLVESHLALTRMRAVETRKDIVFNANKGFAGILYADGTMNISAPSDTARCIPVTMHFNNTKTIAAKFPNWFVWFSVGILIMSIKFNFSKTK